MSAQPKPTETANFTDWGVVALERIEWLMRDRLPFGELTIVEGPGGLGKTTALLDIAARMSTGRPMPDGTRFGGSAHVILIAEEDRASVLKARLVAAGADLALIHHVVSFGDDGRRFSLPTHARDLLGTAREHEARLIIIDALFSHFDEGLRSGLTEDVRRVVVPLSEIAHISGAALTATRHWGKTARAAGERGLGSVDITNVARSVLTVGRDPNDESGARVIAVAKSNLGNDPSRVPSLTFNLESVTVSEGNVDVEVGRVVWGGEVPITADDLANTTPSSAEENTQVGACVEHIRELLVDGPRDANEMQKILKQSDFSRACIFRAKKRAGVRSESSGFPRKAMWSLPSSSTQQSHARDQKNNDTIDINETIAQQSHYSQSSQPSHIRSSDTIGEFSGATGELTPNSENLARRRVVTPRCNFFTGPADGVECKRCGVDRMVHA